MTKQAVARPAPISTANPNEQRDHTRVWMTLVTCPSYLPGLQALARSMRAVGSRYPLYVMYTTSKLSDEDVEVMRKEGCEPIAVEKFMPSNADTSGYKMALYADCWTKLRIWEMEQFSRVVYIDADMLQIRNMDHLFDLPQGFHASRDCYAGRVSCDERDSCPLFGPRCAGANCDYFNAGLFVCEPSRMEFQRMCECVAEASLFQKFGKGYAEQDFLNWYFQGSISFLPYVFNAMKIIRHHHPELWRLEEVHNIHYVDAKPWRRNDPSHREYEDLNDLWWYIYDHMTLPPQIAATVETQQNSNFAKPVLSHVQDNEKDRSNRQIAQQRVQA